MPTLDLTPEIQPFADSVAKIRGLKQQNNGQVPIVEKRKHNVIAFKSLAASLGTIAAFLDTLTDAEKDEMLLWLSNMTSLGHTELQRLGRKML